MVAVLFAFALAAPSPLRLAELLREAQEKNPDLKAAEARTQAARESVSPAGALDDPMLMVQLWNAPVDFSSIPVMVQLTQPIPLGGKRAARTDAARADASMAEAELAGKRREIETQVKNGDALAHILEAIGFNPSFRYEKYRSEWSDSTGHVVIDETPIGNFGEIEGQAKWIDATARRLNIPVKSYLKESYAELFASWKRKTRNKAKEMTFKAIKG